MIRVTIYFATGRESNAADCRTIEDAFNMCRRYGMTAHACNLATDKLYIWRPQADNTMEAFTAKLETPCVGTRK